MTTTPTASPELPDLDKLEAYATSSKNGDWHATEAMLNMLDEDDVLALVAAARRAQPEGEAPQAEPVGEVVLFGRECKEISWAKGKLPPVGAKLYTHPAAATLSPLCGAQHAESETFEIRHLRAMYATLSNDAHAETFSTVESYRQHLLLAFDRSQLDGGQEGSESNG